MIGIDLETETYGDLIAPARTFGYKADEKRLRDMGLIRGASDQGMRSSLAPKGSAEWTAAL